VEQKLLGDHIEEMGGYLAVKPKDRYSYIIVPCIYIASFD